MNLGHLVLPEKKEISKGHGKQRPKSQLEKAPWPKCDHLNNDKVLKDMKYIKIYEFILIFQKKNPRTKQN